MSKIDLLFVAGYEIFGWIFVTWTVNIFIIKKHIIWPRLILCAVVMGLFDTLIIDWNPFTKLPINFVEGALTVIWCIEDDDQRKRRKKRIQDAWNNLKRNLAIHGWQPGAAPSQP